MPIDIHTRYNSPRILRSHLNTHYFIFYAFYLFIFYFYKNEPDCVKQTRYRENKKKNKTIYKYIKCEIRWNALRKQKKKTMWEWGKRNKTKTKMMIMTKKKARNKQTNIYFSRLLYGVLVGIHHHVICAFAMDANHPLFIIKATIDFFFFFFFLYKPQFVCCVFNTNTSSVTFICAVDDERWRIKKMKRK